MKMQAKSILFVILLSLVVTITPLASGQSLELIEWHDCVKKDAIFAWKMTSVDLVDDEQAGFLNDLLIQIKFIANPPSDPARVFNATEAPDWVSVYINGFKVELDQMGEMGTTFTQLIFPISFHFDNGTSFTLEEMYRLASPIEGLDSHYSVEGGYVNATIGNESLRFTSFTNIGTGVAKNISIFIEEMGSLLLEYYVRAANVNENGESTAIEDEYTDFQEDLLTTFRNMIIMAGVAVIGLILVIITYIIYRRKS